MFVDSKPLAVPGPDVDVHGAEVVVLLVTYRGGPQEKKLAAQPRSTGLHPKSRLFKAAEILGRPQLKN